MNVEKSRKHSGVAIYFDSKDNAFAVVKRECKVLKHICERGIPFINRRFTKGGPYSVKNG